MSWNPCPPSRRWPLNWYQCALPCCHDKSHLANGPWNKSLNFVFPTKYVIPRPPPKKSLAIGQVRIVAVVVVVAVAVVAVAVAVAAAAVVVAVAVIVVIVAVAVVFVVVVVVAAVVVVVAVVAATPLFFWKGQDSRCISCVFHEA